MGNAPVLTSEEEERLTGARSNQTNALNTGIIPRLPMVLCAEASVAHNSRTTCINTSQRSDEDGQCLRPKDSCYEAVTTALSFDEIRKLIRQPERQEDVADSDVTVRGNSSWQPSGAATVPSAGHVVVAFGGAVGSVGGDNPPPYAETRLNPLPMRRKASSSFRKSACSTPNRKPGAKIAGIQRERKHCAVPAGIRSRSAPAIPADGVSCHLAVEAVAACLSARGAVFPLATELSDEHAVYEESPSAEADPEVPSRQAPLFWSLPQTQSATRSMMSSKVATSTLAVAVAVDVQDSSVARAAAAGAQVASCDLNSIPEEGRVSTQFLVTSRIDTSEFFEDSDFEGFHEVADEEFLVLQEGEIMKM